MAREYKIGDEAVPGYRLASFLGRGGFGEVWRAVGPGGTEVALKSIALDRKQGMKEFKSLRLVKRIHHPNLVPILAFWLIDAQGHPLDDDSIDLLGSNIIDSKGGPPSAAITATMQFNVARAEQLLIAMGLGEKNLLDILKEYQAKGLHGIPLEELLDYMEGSARAIDFLNTARHDLGGEQPVAIQHCDIKPQNIMLVGDAVQVCDFGLARSLTDVRSTSVAGSIAYGAPELFWENKPTHATDQYSLAITYYELRTGQLPFGPDMAAIEVMQAHRDGKLDLHHLNDAERAVIKRATTPAPAGRFEKTIDMVRALRRATQDGSAVISVEGGLRPPAAGIRSSIVQTGREIVPGYTLLEHLFHPDARTDVWSASAPGGKPQGIWLYDLTSYTGSTDRDALRLIQSLTDHPRLARINGWWMLNKSGVDVTSTVIPLSTMATSIEEALPATLVIATELTRTNLAHRVEECHQFRGKGIPVEELLGYMQQLAEGLDALNEASHTLRGSRWVSLVHTDLRPANVLLFGQAVKIGNFAWCRTLEGEQAELTGMPVRAARPTMGPELVAGRINRRSDQYSLAASYVQMRTGEMLVESGLPTAFASGAVLGSSLDFSALSEGEAEVIHKAMNADPNQRYPTCRKMVAELAVAIKKVPAGVLDTLYAVNVAPGVGTGTMVSSGIVESRRQDTATLPEARSPHDTKPDIYQTVQQEAAAKRGQSRLKLKVAVPVAVVLCAVAGVGLFTGKQTEAQVNQFIADGEYKKAIDAIDSPLWQHWRSNPRTLHDLVVSSATEAAKKKAEEGDVTNALVIQSQLADDLKGNEEKEFRTSVFQVAIQSANEKATKRSYEEAYKIYALLSGIDKSNIEVVELGRSIWKRWEDLIQEHTSLKNFEAAADVFQNLASVDDEHVHRVKATVIQAGINAIKTAESESNFADALDIANRLKSVTAFSSDTGLLNATHGVMPKAITAAQDALKNQKIDDAKDLLELLAKIDAYDTQVRELSKNILDYELSKARGRLEEGNWEAALTEYDRVLANMNKDERDTSTVELDELKGKIVQTAKKEFDETLKDESGKDLDRAKIICDRLGESLPDNLTVKAMADEYKRRASITTPSMPKLTPEMVVLRLLDRIDENIRDRVLEEAQKELTEADAKINAELSTRDDLRRRSTIAHAYLEWQRKDWDKAQSWLAQAKDADLADEAEAAQRTRFHLLGLLVLSRFDGASLPANADLGATSQAIAALRKSCPDWGDSADRLLSTRTKELSRELGRQAANLSASAEQAKRALGEAIIERIDKAFLPDQAALEILVAVNKTIDLLNDAATTPAQVDKSTDSWASNRERLPTDLQGRLVLAFGHWGRESKEPGALAKAIVEVERLPRPSDELCREFAELLVEQLNREAARPKVAWNDLEENCRRAESAVTTAGAADLRVFVKACQAECAVEKALAASTPPPESALRGVEDLLNSDVPEKDRPYVDYVAMHVADATNRQLPDDQAVQIADRLSTTMKSPPAILATDFRRIGAARALLGPAKRLVETKEATTPWSAPKIETEAAGRVYGWVNESLQLDPDLADFSTKLALLTAASSKTLADDQMVTKLIGELSADPECREAWILLRGAKAVSQAKPLEAIRRYARALAMVDPGALVGDAAQETFDKAIKPALALAQKQAPVSSADAEVKKAVAAIFAVKGRLVRTQYTLLEAGQQPDAEAFSAFDQAVRYDPDYAEYYVERGFARWSMSGGSPDLTTLEQQDIAPLFDGKRGAPPPGAFGLRGQAKILAGRQQSGSDRLGFYRQSIKDFEEAIRGSEQQPGEHYSEFLDGLGTANVEISNYTDEGRDAQRAYLNRALELAEKSKAIEFRPHPEHAYINEGNAEEDFSWVMHDTDSNHYCRAIDAFKRAAAEANAALSSPALSMLSQGRCRYKLLASGASCGGTWQDELKAAIGNLDEAIDATANDGSKALSDRLRGQASYWQALLNAWAALNKDKDAAAKKARYQQADAALQKAIEISGKQAAPNYYLESITLAMNLQDYDKAVDRAKKFVGADVATATLDDRVTAIEVMANIQKSRKDAKAALAIYNQYLDDPRFQPPTTARIDLLLDRTELIAKDTGRLWTDNKNLCEESATRAVQLAQDLKDKPREAKAWRMRAENAKLSFSSGTPSLAERKTYAEYLRNAIDCMPGKDDLKDTWGWRYDLSRADYEIANAAAKASAGGDASAKSTALADAAWFSNEALKTLQGVDPFAKNNPALIISIGQVRKTMTEVFQKYKQYLPAK